MTGLQIATSLLLFLVYILLQWKISTWNSDRCCVTVALPSPSIQSERLQFFTGQRCPLPLVFLREHPRNWRYHCRSSHLKDLTLSPQPSKLGSGERRPKATTMLRTRKLSIPSDIPFPLGPARSQLVVSVLPFLARSKGTALSNDTVCFVPEICFI